jgi:hypothetical protein
MMPKLLEELMTYVLAGAVVALFAGVALVAGQSGSVPSSVSGRSTKRDICEFNSRDWSAMRETLVDISRFRGKNDANVQQIAREALAGSRKFSVGEFELQYSRGRSGAPAPNDTVCFPKKATFRAIRNDGNDAAYECEATMDVKGTVLSISCRLVAG